MDKTFDATQEQLSMAEAVLGTSIPRLVEKRAAKDYASFSEAALDVNYFPKASGRLSVPKRTLAAIHAEVTERAFQANPIGWGANPEYMTLLRKHGLMLDQVVSRIEDPKMRESAMRALRETTTPSDIATVACQLIAMVTRAMANNPVLDLVTTVNLTQVSGQVAYLDVLRAAACGSYSAGDRVDLQDAGNCWDRTTCTDTIAKLNARIQRETATATDKALGADICLPAQQDALSQWGVNLQEFLSNEIVRQMIREWARNVADDLRTMAGNTGTWSSTVPGPYSSLNLNEWRKALFEAVVAGDALIRADIYEGAQWMLIGTALGGTLRKIKRFVLNAPAAQNQAGTVGLVSGEFGTMEDWLSYWEDPFFAANTVLIGRKESSQVQNGFYYWLPYIMADQVYMLLDPQTLQIHLGAITRAARKMVEVNAFHRIDVSGSGAAL